MGWVVLLEWEREWKLEWELRGGRRSELRRDRVGGEVVLVGEERKEGRGGLRCCALEDHRRKVRTCLKVFLLLTLEFIFLPFSLLLLLSSFSSFFIFFPLLQYSPFYNQPSITEPIYLYVNLSTQHSIIEIWRQRFQRSHPSPRRALPSPSSHPRRKAPLRSTPRHFSYGPALNAALPIRKVAVPE